MKPPEPFAWFQWNDSWQVWEMVRPDHAGEHGVVAAYREPPARAGGYDFDTEIASLCAREVALARGDPERCGAMIERLARALGFSVAMAADGDGPTIDTMMTGAEAYAHEEAVDKAGLAQIMAHLRGMTK